MNEKKIAEIHYKIEYDQEEVKDFEFETDIEFSEFKQKIKQLFSFNDYEIENMELFLKRPDNSEEQLNNEDDFKCAIEEDENESDIYIIDLKISSNPVPDPNYEILKEIEEKENIIKEQDNTINKLKKEIENCTELNEKKLNKLTKTIESLADKYLSLQNEIIGKLKELENLDKDEDIQSIMEKYIDDFKSNIQQILN